MLRKPLVGLVVLLGSSTVSATGASEPAYLAYSGTARVPGSGEFLYREHHVLKYRDGRLAQRIVLYSCVDGSYFARKISNYSDPLAPDFAL